jgi:spore coat protein CotF
LGIRFSFAGFQKAPCQGPITSLANQADPTLSSSLKVSLAMAMAMAMALWQYFRSYCLRSMPIEQI